jgi:3-phenylpropionate/cinnamic acid dioxygenase small subunit
MTNITLEPADHLAISNVLFTVARAMDERDWITFSSCFTDDAIGDYANGNAIGRNAILTATTDFLTPLDATQHLIGNVQTAGGTNEVASHATFIAQHVRTAAAGTGRFMLGGNYDDRFRRTSNGWLITRRTIRGVWSDGDQTVLQTPAPRRS